MNAKTWDTHRSFMPVPSLTHSGLVMPYGNIDLGQNIGSRNGFPDSKVHGSNIGHTWVLSAPDGPHVGPVNLAIRVVALQHQAITWTKVD